LELAWVGGVKGYRLDLLRDLCLLALGQRSQVESARVRTFGSIDALRNFAQRMDDREFLARIELVRRCDPGELLLRVERMTAAAERREAGPSKKRASVAIRPADVHLATVHKAKGLEWDTVVLGEDFPSPEDLLQPGQGIDLSQEANALYVALTRAQKALQLPEPLARAYARDSECFAYAEAPPAAEVAAQPLAPCPCCGEQLPAASVAASSSCWARTKMSSAGLAELVAVGGVTLQRLCTGCAAKACRERPIAPSDGARVRSPGQQTRAGVRSVSWDGGAEVIDLEV